MRLGLAQRVHRDHDPRLVGVVNHPPAVSGQRMVNAGGQPRRRRPPREALGARAVEVALARAIMSRPRHDLLGLAAVRTQHGGCPPQVDCAGAQPIALDEGDIAGRRRDGDAAGGRDHEQGEQVAHGAIVTHLRADGQSVAP